MRKRNKDSKEAGKVLREREGRLQGRVGEMQHRGGNIMTVVRSVFSRTVEGERPIEEIAEHFRGPLDSLARTQVLLAQYQAGLIDLENLIRDGLLSVGFQDGPRLSIKGPAPQLSPVQGELLALAIGKTIV